MRKLFAFITILTLLNSNKFAFAKNGQAGFFYEVTKNGYKSFILGTLHRGIAISDLDPMVRQILEKSDSIVVEQIFSEELTKQFFSNPWGFREEFEIEYLGIKPEDHTNKVPTRETLEKLFQIGFPKKLAEFVRNDMCDLATDESIDFSNPQNLDYEIIQFSYEVHKRLVQLDDDNFIHQLKDHPQDYLSCNLDMFISRIPVQELRNTSATYKSYYLNGTILDGYKPDPEIIKRNKSWIKKLLPVLDKGNAFIAFGVGHLAGPQGVLSLLSKEGFSIKTVKFKDQK